MPTPLPHASRPMLPKWQAASVQERREGLRDLIAATPDQAFMMSLWDCSTSACIGGHAQRLFYGLHEDWMMSIGVEKALGLSDIQGHDLMFRHAHSDVTRGEALATLDRLCATGEVKWSRDASTS